VRVLILGGGIAGCAAARDHLTEVALELYPALEGARVRGAVGASGRGQSQERPVTPAVL
jgi:uncharacterized protein with NAD-binding domain and iron-sulfur cluster